MNSTQEVGPALSKCFLPLCWASLVAQTVKHLSAMQETWVQSLGWEDPLEKEMAAHSSILAWKIPWTAEPARLQFMGSQRVRHDWVTSLHFLCVTLWLGANQWLAEAKPGPSLKPQRGESLTSCWLSQQVQFYLGWEWGCLASSEDWVDGG